MVEVIEKNLAQITEICRKHGVKRLELFGSAARGTFDPQKSDLDFFVDYLPDDSHDVIEQWFGLIEDLEALTGTKIDLVSRKDVWNPYFLEVANRHRVELYAA
jgi:predicted nucleotidyltransferase